MGLMHLDYRMYDADNHFYEARDAFTRHLDPKYAKDFFWVTDERGHQHIIVNGKFWNYIPNPTFDPISKPGSLTDLFSGAKSKEQIEMDGFKIVEPLAERPEYMNRDARIQRMDEQGVEAALMLPTLVSGLEHQTRDNIDLTYGLLDAFNRYILDDWAFDYQNRIFATPVISLADVDRGIAQLEFALDHGARAIFMRPAPIPTAEGTKSPGDEMFDPFWARCAEAGTVVVCHLGESGYYGYAGDWTGEREFKPFRTSAFEKVYIDGRAIADFVTAFICHGGFARNPGLRLASIENGSEWVLPLAGRLKKHYQRTPGEFPSDPIEDLKRCVYVNPYWEDPIADLTEVVELEHLLAGSDFPHAEGLSEPHDYIKGLDDFSEEDQRKIMRENLRSLLETAA